MAMVNRFDIFLVNLDAEVAKNARNTRPGVVISPDELNHNVPHVLIAPVSTVSDNFPTRVAIDLLGSRRAVVLDQMRTVDSERLVKKIGAVEAATQKQILTLLAEFFAE
jgi:mRNA interferase MazF